MMEHLTQLPKPVVLPTSYPAAKQARSAGVGSIVSVLCAWATPIFVGPYASLAVLYTLAFYVLAVWLGVLSLRRASMSRREVGPNGSATAGVVTSIIGLSLFALSVLAMLLAVFMYVSSTTP
jgi:hypothetical protein